MPTIRQLGAAHAELGLPSSAHAKLSEVKRVRCFDFFFDFFLATPTNMRTPVEMAGSILIAVRDETFSWVLFRCSTLWRFSKLCLPSIPRHTTS